MAGASRFPFLIGAVNMRRSAGSVPAQARSARPPVGARCFPWTLLTLARHGLARRPADNHRREPGTAVWRVTARPHSLVLRRTACVMVMPLPGLAWLTRPHAAARTPRPSDAFHLQCSWISHPRGGPSPCACARPPPSGPSPCACAQPPPRGLSPCACAQPPPERPVAVRVRRESSAEVPDGCSLAPALAPEEHFWADEAVGGRRVPAAVTGSPEIARGAAPPTGVPQASSRRDAREESAASAVPPPPVFARCRVRRLGLVTHPGERPGSAALGFPSVRPSLFWLEQIRRGSRPHILSRNERRLRPGDENAPWMLPLVGVDHVTPSEPGGHS